MSMKIIFLDIDGVLNSVDSTVAFADDRLEYKLTNEERLDPVSIGLLKRLCRKTGAKIVVSSTWRIGRSCDDFLNIFSNYGWLDFPYIGQTESLRGNGNVRGHEIKDWLDRHPEVESYIILDDDSDMLKSQKERFVHVSNINGFRSQHYCQCLKLFGHPNEMLEKQVNWVRTSERVFHD